MSKSDTETTTEPELTPDERAELEDWTSPWEALGIHSEVDHQLERALNGQENTVIVGSRGLGKSETIKKAVARLEDSEMSRSADDPPRKILYYESAEAAGAKTVLEDLFEELDSSISKHQIRVSSQRTLINRLIQDLKLDGVTAICIDEAQNINAKNLEQLLLLYNQAQLDGYPLGIVLVGNYGLLDNLREKGQLGQRITCELRFPEFKAAAGTLPQWHPQLARLKTQLKRREWNAIKKRITTAANGSLRRLDAIVRNANDLALRLNRRIDVEVVEWVLDRLPSEV